MRTTINLEGDLLDKARAMAQKLRKPFRRVINEALRLPELLEEQDPPLSKRIAKESMCKRKINKKGIRVCYKI